jgi:hypothetical protein
MPEPIIIKNYIITNEICSYCQEQSAKFAYRNGKLLLRRKSHKMSKK